MNILFSNKIENKTTTVMPCVSLFVFLDFYESDKCVTELCNPYCTLGLFPSDSPTPKSSNTI